MSLLMQLSVSVHIHVSDSARMSNCSSAMRSWIMAERRMAEWTLKLPKFMVIGFDVRFLNCICRRVVQGCSRCRPTVAGEMQLLLMKENDSNGDEKAGQYMTITKSL